MDVNGQTVDKLPVDVPWIDENSPLKGGTRESVAAWLDRQKQTVREKTALDYLFFFIPCLKWITTYKVREYLLWDITAGLSVGAMVIPQSMSYANLAGLPSVYGLYGAFMPVITYAILGSSRQLAVGPVAVTSALISSGLQDIIPNANKITNPNKPGKYAAVQEHYNHAAVQLALLVAVFYTAVGLFRLGFITRFLSHPIISGFTSGAAIQIGSSQLKYFLGIKYPSKNLTRQNLEEVFKQTDNWQWKEFVMGFSWLVILLTFKEVGKRSKRFRFLRSLGPLTVTVLGIAIINIFNLNSEFKVVGNIPKGLPKPTISWWSPLTDPSKLVGLAIVVMLVDLCESMSIAKALALKNDYELVPNQEIVGLGIANFVGAIFNCYSTTGSFSRSAVSNDTGSKTQLFGLVVAMVVMFTLLFLTPVFKNMPQNVQGAIVISAVLGLINFGEARRLFKVNKFDFLVWLVAFIGVVVLGVEIGLGIAVGLAIVIVIYQSAFPHTALLGQLPGSTVFRNVQQYRDAEPPEGMLVMRVDAPIYFANVQWIRDRISSYQKSLEAAMVATQRAPLRYIILDLSPCPFIDATGVHMVEELLEQLKKRNLTLALANPSNRVMRQLQRADLDKKIGRQWIFARTHDAVQYCKQKVTADEWNGGSSSPNSSEHGKPNLDKFNSTNPILIDAKHSQQENGGGVNGAA